MAAPPAMKSQGMRFAEEQLQRHGWTEGKGLGRRENGIAEAIKVKVKCDQAGVGHNSAEQFTFHWWDHVFNKTASSISVEQDQDGVQVRKATEDDTTVTNRKPRKALSNRDMLYGRFIKSATLLSGGETPVEKESSSESGDSSDDEDEKLDLSSATKLTDEDLMRICGGRTAHKGARHGLTMSAKLSRIEEQERAFLEKYGKKEPKKEAINGSTEEDLKTGRKNKSQRQQDRIENGIQDNSSDTMQPKKKKKKKTAVDEEVAKSLSTGYDDELTPSKGEDIKTLKMRNVELQDALNGFDKRKKDVAISKKRKVAEEVVEEMSSKPEDHHHHHHHLTEEDLKSSKKKKKRVLVEEVKQKSEVLEDHAEAIDEEVQPAKKKKKRKAVEHSEEDLLNGHQYLVPLEEQKYRPSKKKQPKNLTLEEKDDELEESTEDHVHRKKKRKKEYKVEDHATDLGEEKEDCQTSKKKKKKSKNQCNDHVVAVEEAEAVDCSERRTKCKKKRKDKS